MTLLVHGSCRAQDLNGEIQGIPHTDSHSSVTETTVDSGSDPSSLVQPNNVLAAESRYLVADNSTNPSSLGPTDNGSPGNPKLSPAVRDVTDRRSSWWDDFLNKTSPFHVGLEISEMYDDNIFIQQDKTADFVTSITPEFTAEFGDNQAPNSNYFFALAKYTELLYAQNPGEDAENYFLDFKYQHQFTRLMLGIEQQVRRETDTNIDIGNRVTSNVYVTVGTANYAYNDDVTLHATISQAINNYNSSTYFDTTERVLDFYALYQVLPKLSIGIGPRVGFVDVESNPSQTYEDALVDLFYKATDKTNITLVAGPEVREYEDKDGQSITPVVDLTVDYAPFDSTTLKFDAHRRRVVSYGTLDEDYMNNEVEASARQRLFQKMYVNFAVGYDLNDYMATGDSATAPTREDNYYYLRGGLEWDPTEWLTVSGDYRYSRDDSNDSGFSFNDNQVELGVHAKY